MNKYESDNLTGINHEGAKQNIPLKFLTATSVMSNNIVNLKGEELGEVKDVMLDVNRGRIEYLVMSAGGFLGIGEKLFAIPFTMVYVHPNEHSFIFDYDEKLIKEAPGFDKDHWPNTNSHDMESSRQYWSGFMGPNAGYDPSSR